MKIALLHYTAPPVVGGVEAVVGIHAGLMAEQGHQVRILAGRGARANPHVPFLNLPLLDSRHPEILAVKAELDAGRVPASFAELTRRILDALVPALEDVEVLIAHNVCSLHKNLPLTAALDRLCKDRPGLQLILWHHDLAWTAPRYRAELHPGYPWDLLSRDWLCAKHVVVSELRQAELSALLAVPVERIRVIPNGVDFARFLKFETRTSALIEPLNLEAASPLLLLPVRITPRKNIELALNTLAALRCLRPQAALVVTGPLGPHNPANQRYYEQLIHLRAQLGLEACAHFLAELSAEYLPDEVIADFFQIADALFFPSREEGFGIPVLEAGLARLPVFCADIPPLRKLGLDWAVYFSPDARASELAVQIHQRLADDPAFNLRRRVADHFTWERIYREQIAPLLEMEGTAA